MNYIKTEHFFVFHPGYYIEEYMEERKISLNKLAIKLQVSPLYLNDLINGYHNVDEAMASKLANVFGSSKKFWLNLNQAYLDGKAEIEKLNKDKKH